MNNGDCQAVLASGTDEHGIKIQKAAESKQEDPKDLCDRVSQRFRALAHDAGVNCTRFIRTTDADHIKSVNHLWKRLSDLGFIYKGKHEGWYSTSDEAFYTSTQIQTCSENSNKMVSTETGSVVEWSSEENYKFRLSVFQEPLLAWLDDNPDAVLPASRRDSLKEELREGLTDLSISRPRSRLHWGIPVPDDESHTIYVWLDALTNYLTVSGYPWSSTDMGCWPADLHVIGKDILRFHAIYFPAFLMALSLPLPQHILTHGHWTMNKTKMSKSRGNVADPFLALQSFGKDELRWLMCRIGGNAAVDADWSESTLAEFHRKYLQGQLGNLISRVMAPKVLQRTIACAQESGMLPLHMDASLPLKLPKPDLFSNKEDTHLVDSLEKLARQYEAYMEQHEVHRALDLVNDVLADCNRVVQIYEPWREPVFNDPKERFGHVWKPVYLALETSRLCALLLQPVMPEKAAQLLNILEPSLRNTWEDSLALQSSITIPTHQQKIPPLFPKLIL